jgi:hypothetical protein
MCATFGPGLEFQSSSIEALPESLRSVRAGFSRLGGPTFGLLASARRLRDPSLSPGEEDETNA